MEKYGCSLENFIIKDENDSAYSICREERQYAVFLYDILRKYKNSGCREGAVGRIFEACGLGGAEIVDVFYEPTFMRDFYERKRRMVIGNALELNGTELEKMLKKKSKSTPKNLTPTQINKIRREDCFNYQLINYLHPNLNNISNEKLWKIEKNNLGGLPKDCKEGTAKRKIKNEVEEVIREMIGETEVQSILNLIRQMMNAKSDIAVVYEKNKQRYLIFLECKLEYNDTSYDENSTQTDIQWKIAEFLCKHCFNEEISVPEKMANEPRKSRLVRFVREEAGAGNPEIQISDLINLSAKIFEQTTPSPFSF